MADQNTKYLCYGDYVFLHSANKPTSYLCARSLLEEKILFLQSPSPRDDFPFDQINSSFYENPLELVFMIYPKLNYQADKNFNKLKSNENSLKIELLRKRLEVEQEQNQALIDKAMHTPVTFGSEIQLFHVSSKCFVRASREKHDIMNDLYKLRLSKTGGPGVYFKIAPFLTLKREGEKVSIRDHFYLENLKIQACIVDKRLPPFPETYTRMDLKIPGPSKSPNTLLNANKKPSDFYMPIMEISKTFTPYEAGLRHQDQTCAFGVSLVSSPDTFLTNSKMVRWGDYVRIRFTLKNKNTAYLYCDSTIIGNAPWVYCRNPGASSPSERESFQGIFQIVAPSEDFYGKPIKFKASSKTAALRLRHLLTGRYLVVNEPNTTSRLSQTISGVLTGDVDLSSLDNKASPQKDSGSTIASFWTNIFSKSPEKQGTVILENPDEVTTIPIKLPELKPHADSVPVATQQVSKLKKGGSVMLSPENPLPAMRKRGSVMLSPGTGVAAFSSAKKRGSVMFLPGSPGADRMFLFNPEEEISGPVQKFVKKTQIVLKNATDDDEKFLTKDTMFSIQSVETDQQTEDEPVAMLSVSQGKKDSVTRSSSASFEWMNRPAYSDANFEARFHKRNPLGREEYEVMVTQRSTDYFYLNVVSADEISLLMTVQSLTYPIIKMIEEITLIYKNKNHLGVPIRPLAETVKRRSTRSLLADKKNKKDNNFPTMETHKSAFLIEGLESIRKLLNWLVTPEESPEIGKIGLPYKQKITREVGIIDILIDLLNTLFVKGLLKADIKDNQQYQTLTQSVFDLLQTIVKHNKANNVYVFQWSKLFQEMTLAHGLAGELGVEKLLSQIFFEQIIPIHELPEIPRYLTFEVYDLKALNIAIALYQYNALRPLKDRDEIISTLVVNNENRSRIFREFTKTDSGDIIVRIKSDGRPLKIDQTFEYRERRVFDYIMGHVALVNELTKAKPHVVASFFRPYFPLFFCTETFENKKWNYHLRSVFVDLFLEMYFNIDSSYLLQVAFPSNIKFLRGSHPPEEVKLLTDSRKDRVLSFFMTSQFNIKAFIQDFLQNPGKLTTIKEHRYIKSVFSVIYAMCQKGLYTRQEIKDIKDSIYDYLKLANTIWNDHDAQVKEKADEEIITAVRQGESLRSGNTGTMKKLESRKSTNKFIEKFKINTEHTEEAHILSVLQNTTMNRDLLQTEMDAAAAAGKEEPIFIEGEEDEEDEYEKPQPYMKDAMTMEMIGWMQEGVQLLSFIEGYELDCKIADFFKEEEVPKYYDEKILLSNEYNTTAKGFAKMKQDKVLLVNRYLDTMVSPVNQDYKQILLLLDLLLLNNTTFTYQIVHLLYLNFSNFKHFLTSLNTSTLIAQFNLDLYSQFFKINDMLRMYKLELEKLYGPDLYSTGPQIYESISSVLDGLVDKLAWNKDLSRDPNLAAPLTLYRFYPDYGFDIKTGKPKQELMKSLNLFDTVTEIFKPLVEGVYFNKNLDQWEKFLKSFLLFYGFFCISNPENQQLVAKNGAFLECLLSIEAPALQPLLLRVFSEIFRDNYSVLIELPRQQSNNVIQLLLNKFFKNLSSKEVAKNDFFIHCLRIFPIFFQISNNYLIQNQNYFASQFYSRLIDNSNDFNIKIFLGRTLFNLLSDCKPRNFQLEHNPFEVRVPLEISFAISFLNTLSLMVAGVDKSNSVACLNNKFYLSIPEILVLLKAAGEWFNLKLTLITFLNHTYIRNKKLEDNELADLTKLLREVLFEDLAEYLSFLKHRRRYERPSGQRFVPHYHTLYTIPTEYVYNQVIDAVYHQYILYGVMDAFVFYSQRLKETPSENEYGVLDDFVSSYAFDLEMNWGIFAQQQAESKDGWRLAAGNMLNAMDEPSDAVDLTLNEIPEVQKNERKRVFKLKRELVTTVVRIKKREKAQNLKIWLAVDNNEEQGKKLSTRYQIESQMIEDKHGMELSALMNILLTVKKLDTEKFKKIIKSLINVVCAEGADPEAKKSTLQILRKLGNVKDMVDMDQSIQTDLLQLDFVDFYMQMITQVKEEDEKMDYILGMIDFMDEVTLDIQEELYHSLLDDEENSFLENLKEFIVRNFEEFREHEKNYNHLSYSIQQNAKVIVYKKMYNVIYTLELLRLFCENHYEPMQNYLREQVQEGVKTKRSINFITLIADIFNRYTKSVNERNAPLGLQILDTLIEWLQGPCHENQLAICNTKVLENLEDLTVEIKKIRKKRDKPVWAEMTKRILTLIQAIFEGTHNDYILNQVSIHINVELFLERMEEIYEKFIRLNWLQRPARRAKNGPERENSFKRLRTQKTIKAGIEELAATELEPSSASQQQQKSNQKDNEQQDSELQTPEYHALFINEGIELAIIIKLFSVVSPLIKQNVEKFNPLRAGKKILKKCSTAEDTDIDPSISFFLLNIFILSKIGSKSKNKLPDNPDKFRTQRVKEKLEEEDPERFNEFEKIERYYDKYIGQIEIINKKGDLQQVYFQIPKKTKYLSNYTKNLFLERVPRESANEKLTYLLLMQKSFINEMDHFFGLSKYASFFFNMTSLSLARKTNLFINFIINLIILFDKKISNPMNDDGENYLYKGDHIIYWFGIIQIIFSSLILFIWCFSQAPLELKIATHGLKPSKKSSRNLSQPMTNPELIEQNPRFAKILKKLKPLKPVFYMIFETYLMYFLVLLLLAFLGTFKSKVFFAFILFDVIDENPTLTNVIKSVTTNYKQLLMTIVLGILMVYMYGVIGYFAVIESDSQDYENYCSTPLHCFLSMAMNALTSGGGGVGDMLTAVTVGDADYVKRYFFDLFYFLTMMILLLNLIFGIIIDSFAELRDEKRAKDYDQGHVCFICNLERTTFDKDGVSFEEHIRSEHNLWNYIYYIVYLQQKNKFDYNGTEYFINQKIQNDDLTWFPLQKAMSLPNASHEIIEDFGADMVEKLSKFETGVVADLKVKLAELMSRLEKKYKAMGDFKRREGTGAMSQTLPERLFVNPDN